MRLWLLFFKEPIGGLIFLWYVRPCHILVRIRGNDNCSVQGSPFLSSILTFYFQQELHNFVFLKRTTKRCSKLNHFSVLYSTALISYYNNIIMWIVTLLIFWSILLPRNASRDDNAWDIPETWLPLVNFITAALL